MIRSLRQRIKHYTVVLSLGILYTGWPKKVSHYQFFKKNRIIDCMPTILDFFVKLKYESSTIIQPVGNKYSVRDLLL